VGELWILQLLEDLDGRHEIYFLRIYFPFISSTILNSKFL
jgi:hypothetical protein